MTTPNLLFGHVVCHVFKTLIVEHVTDIGCHYVSNFGLGRVMTLFAHETHSYVAVCKHSNQPIILGHGQQARIGFAHHLCNVPHVVIGADQLYLTNHHVGDTFSYCLFSAVVPLLLLSLRYALFEWRERLFCGLAHGSDHGRATL